MRLVCARCGAGLVPAWAGLRCPRMAACGRGGYEETGAALHARLVWERLPGHA